MMGIEPGQAAAEPSHWGVQNSEWLAEWFSRHGLAGVPVSDVDRQTLAVAVAAEFDSWCENRGISLRQQNLARARARRRLPAEAMNQGLCVAAVDVAAWHDLRVACLQVAS